MQTSTISGAFKTRQNQTLEASYMSEKKPRTSKCQVHVISRTGRSNKLGKTQCWYKNRKINLIKEIEKKASKLNTKLSQKIDTRQH